VEVELGSRPLDPLVSNLPVDRFNAMCYNGSRDRNRGAWNGEKEQSPEV